MQITVERYGFGRDSTLGELLMDGIHEGYTLEDERRLVKVHGETCVPIGTYRIRLRTEGGMTQRYAVRFPEIHAGMLWLQDVPEFSWVYFHVGNDDEDTRGCILVGRLPVVLPDGEFRIAESANAYRPFYRKVATALQKGEPVTVTIRERPIP